MFLMAKKSRQVNLVLSGGGVKGIAYAGVFETAEKRGYRWGNIAGVSVGAIAGAFAASGFNYYEMWESMKRFDFKGIQIKRVSEKLPVIYDYLQFARSTRSTGPESIRMFLNRSNFRSSEITDIGERDINAENRNLLDNIIVYSKNGCIFDGDILEEWCAAELRKKGIRTFGDLKGGKKDTANPEGYKVRMTGVDCNRARLVVLPDDARFYGIDPDELEVAKAVRISTCIPFVFKPVVLSKKEDGKVKNYNLVDGGVFDRFPYWAIDRSNTPTVGFKLDGGEKKGFFSLDNALNILKSLVSAVHDIGVPKDGGNYIKHVGSIDTSKVHTINFNLSEEDKLYLFRNGRLTAINLFNRFEKDSPRDRLL